VTNLITILLGTILLVNGCASADVTTDQITANDHLKAVTPVVKTSDWWMPRHEANVERIQRGDVDLLMIGDSITHRWESDGIAIDMVVASPGSVRVMDSDALLVGIIFNRQVSF